MDVAIGLFGRKGAGKSHELVRTCLDLLRQGRRVCMVMPQLDKDKVIRYLADDTVEDRLTVVGYDALRDPRFFPNESIITKLQTWRRFNIDYSTQDPSPDSPLNEIPHDAWRWHESIFRPGDALIVDEAWRIMRNENVCPPGFRTALHMARHWRGPKDWRNADDCARYLSSDWFPGLGGPEWMLESVQDPNYPDDPKRKIERKRYLGGDGTEMVTSNLIVASQNYGRLAKGLTEQLHRSTLLIKVDNRNLPDFAKNKEEPDSYMAYTFESEYVPSWRELERAVQAKKPIWVGEEQIFHSDEIHALYEYADGFAEETDVDDKATLAKNPEFKRAKKLLIAATLFMLFLVAIGIFAYSKMPSVTEAGSGIAGPPASKEESDADKVAASSQSAPVSAQNGSGAQVSGYDTVSLAGSVGAISIVRVGDGFQMIKEGQSLNGIYSEQMAPASSRVVHSGTGMARNTQRAAQSGGSTAGSPERVTGAQRERNTPAGTYDLARAASGASSSN